MNLQLLHDIIQNSLSGGLLKLSTPELKSAGIDRVAADYLPDNTIRLAGARIENSSGNDITVHGTGVDLPFTDMPATLRLYLDGDEAGFQLVARGGDGWTLKMGVPPLINTIAGDLAFLPSPHNPQLVLDSHSAQSVLSFEGTVDLNTLTGGLASLLGQPQLPISGSISLIENGSGLEAIEMNAPVLEKVDLGFATVEKLAVKVGIELFYHTRTNTYYTGSFIQLSAEIPFKAQGRQRQLPISARMLNSKSAIRFQADLTDAIDAGLDEIKSLTNQVGLGDFLPKADFHLEDVLMLNEFFFDLDLSSTPTVTMIGVGIQSVSPWTILHLDASGKDLAVKNLSLDFTIYDPFGASATSMSVRGEVAFGNTGTLVLFTSYPDWFIQAYLKEGTTLELTEILRDFFGSATDVPEMVVDVFDFELSSGGHWKFNAAYNGDISLSDVGKAFGFTDIPEELESFIFAGLDVSFTSESGHLSGSGIYVLEDGQEVGLNLGISKTASGAEFSGSFAYPDIDGRGNDLDCHVNFIKKEAGFESSFTLEFPVASRVINLEGAITKDQLTKECVTELSGTIKASILLSDILEDLLPDDDQDILSEGLVPDISVKDISAFYGKKATPGTSDAGQEIKLSAVADIEGKEVSFFFQYKKAGLQSSNAFGLQTELSGLSGMPMVGAQFKEVRIENLGFVYASQEGEWDERQFEKGLTMSGEIWLPKGDTPFSLSLPVSRGKSTEDGERIAPPTGTAASTSTDLVQAPRQVESAIKWIKINKDIGPLRIVAVGFEYKEKYISLFFSGGVNLAGLTVSLNGLGLSFLLNKLLEGDPEPPSFSLDGLGLGFKSGPVEISGAFLKDEIDGIPIYNGSAIIKAEDFTISGLGSYATINNEPSLFIFALYEGAIGGPPFFTVNGLAAGFGYNRRVKIPDIDKVEDFPFVKLAMAPPDTPKPLDEILSELTDHMVPSIGDYWLAIGVKFNSFKLVDSFALMIASFGKSVDFRLDILGVSKLVFPVQEKVNDKLPPIIAEVRMAFQATFIPSEGFLGVRAQLIEGSYILSKDCVLSGGFAFYSWFDGPHKGDFVQTMGGYHPAFKKPDHYPDVPRLGFNWNVSTTVTIKGEMYFAMTPTMMMAGGRLEAAYKDGSVRAWFIIGADFLISWEPFFYDARFYINVGAEYKKDCGLFDLIISIDVGADVHVWGPEFRGTAVIDLDIFTVNVSFGADSTPGREFISWEKFQQSFLPPEEEICGVFVNQGLLRTIKEKEIERWIINPKDLVISTNSEIPLKTGEIKGGKINILILKEDKSKTEFEVKEVKGKCEGKRVFGIEPMGLKFDQLKSGQKVVITRKGEDNKDILANIDFTFDAIYKNIPKALWQEAGDAPGNPNLGDAEGTISHILSGFKISPAKAPDPGNTKKIDQDVLMVDISNNPHEFDIPDHAIAGFEVNNLDAITTTIENNNTREALMTLLHFESKEFDLSDIDEYCFMNIPLFEKVT